MDVQAAGPGAALPRPRGRGEALPSSRTPPWCWAARRRTSSATSARYGASTSFCELHERVRPVIDSDGLIVGINASAAMPPVEVVDMREELKTGNRSIFSRPLQIGLYQALEKGEQAILFLNRRGIAGFVQCRDCGYVPQCPACAIALACTPHPQAPSPSTEKGTSGAGGGRGASGPEPPSPLTERGAGGRGCSATSATAPGSLFERCPMCGSARLRPMGLGVERVEEEVTALFPKARALRWDRDVTQGRNAHEKILARFVAGQGGRAHRHADGREGPGPAGRDAGRRDQRRHRPAHPGLPLRRAHVPAADAGVGPGRARRRRRGRAAARATSSCRPTRRTTTRSWRRRSTTIARFFATESAIRRESAYPPFMRLARLVYRDANEEHGQRQAERLARELARRGLAPRPAGRRGLGAGAATRPEVARPLPLADHGALAGPEGASGDP